MLLAVLVSSQALGVAIVGAQPESETQRKVGGLPGGWTSPVVGQTSQAFVDKV